MAEPLCKNCGAIIDSEGEMCKYCNREHGYTAVNKEQFYRLMETVSCLDCHASMFIGGEEYVYKGKPLLLIGDER